MVNFNWVRGAFSDFVTTYQQNIISTNHASEFPIQSVNQATTIKVHK